MRILAPGAPHRHPPKSILSVHLPSALAPDRAARPGPPWRGLHCCPSSSGAAAPGPWDLFTDKTEQPQALQALLAVPLLAPASHCSQQHNLETPKPHLRETWLEQRQVVSPGHPTVAPLAPQPQITHLCPKLGWISSKHGDILINSSVPESSEAQGGHLPAIQGLSPGHLKQDLVNPRGGIWEP